MKSFDGELVVATREDGTPRLISWSGNTYYVLRILKSWEERNRWWSRERRREYFQVETNRNLLEIYRSGNRWVLVGILDEVEFI